MGCEASGKRSRPWHRVGRCGTNKQHLSSRSRNDFRMRSIRKTFQTMAPGGKMRN
ncbi:MAG: hypothetical protein K2P50_15620 [Lachnospiraceae bacterium]|nr:hypothetical protein [Lachnospiraceae bacterium]